MVRRVVEEDVVAPSTTVVEDDSSWIGRTIVTLVILALLVAGAVWMVRAISNDGTGVDQTPTEQNDQNDTNDNPDNGTDQQPIPTSIPS